MKTEYINGSDLLIKVAGGAMGHATSHTTTLTSETKDRAVKPLASVTTIGAGLWKEKGVTGLSISISAEGLRNYSESENGFKELLTPWFKGQSVEVEAFERGNDSPYLSGKFIITSIEESAPAEDDATYSINLENTGVVTYTPANLTSGATADSDEDTSS